MRFSREHACMTVFDFLFWRQATIYSMHISSIPAKDTFTSFMVHISVLFKSHHATIYSICHLFPLKIRSQASWSSSLTSTTQAKEKKRKAKRRHHAPQSNTKTSVPPAASHPIAIPHQINIAPLERSNPFDIPQTSSPRHLQLHINLAQLTYQDDIASLASSNKRQSEGLAWNKGQKCLSWLVKCTVL